MDDPRMHNVSVPAIELFVGKLPPTGVEWLNTTGSAYIMALGLATVCTLFVLVITSIQLICIHKYISREAIQTDLYYLSMLLPIVAVCSVLAMYMPRSATFMFTICLTYLMVCLLMIVHLMRNLFRKRGVFSNCLTENDQKIFFDAPPLCCCCKCCPKIEPTEKNLHHIEFMVAQSPFVRIAMEILLVISFLEGHTSTVLTSIITTVEAISMLIATWGCQILTLLSQEHLKEYRFGTVFKMVNMTQVLFTLQKLIFDLIGHFHGFDDSYGLSSTLKAFFWNNFTMCLEMVLLSGLTTYLISPKRSALFDRYPGVPRDRMHSEVTQMGKLTKPARENQEIIERGEV